GHDRPQIIAALLLYQTRAVLAGHVVNARLFQVVFNIFPDCIGLVGNGEGGQGGFRVFRRQRLDGTHAQGQCRGDFLRVARYPDAGAVDAATAAVDEDAVYHDVEVFLPLIHLVVAQDDLAEAGAVRLHARVALVLLDGRRAAEDQAARAVIQHSRPHVAETG